MQTHAQNPTSTPIQLSPENFQRLRNLIADAEGYRQFVYKDTVGKLTIGYGRNVQDRGVTKDEANVLLVNDINWAIDKLHNSFPFFAELTDVRKMVLVDMCYNLGFVGLLGFEEMLSALGKGDYYLASQEMLDSKWAKQVGDRAEILSEMMCKGVIPHGY